MLLNQSIPIYIIINGLTYAFIIVLFPLLFLFKYGGFGEQYYYQYNTYRLLFII